MAEPKARVGDRIRVGDIFPDLQAAPTGQLELLVHAIESELVYGSLTRGTPPRS